MVHLLEKAGNADAVIISDYGKGFVTNEALEFVKRVNQPIFFRLTQNQVDPSIMPPDLLTPNRFEALEMVGMSRESQARFSTRMRLTKKFLSILHPKMLAVTLGSEGMLLAENGKVKVDSHCSPRSFRCFRCG